MLFIGDRCMTTNNGYFNFVRFSSLANIKILCLAFLLMIVSGCSGPSIDIYADNNPEFVAEDFFDGSLTAHGIVKNRSGEVIRTFNASLEGSWNDGEGLLAERFVFDDGEVQYRNWQLLPLGSKSNREFIGRAEDVVGDAEVKTNGNAMFIRYTLQIPYNGSTIDVQVDDRMYLVSDRVLINESKLTKWGIDVGEIVLTIIKAH